MLQSICMFLYLSVCFYVYLYVVMSICMLLCLSVVNAVLLKVCPINCISPGSTSPRSNLNRIPWLSNRSIPILKVPSQFVCFNKTQITLHCNQSLVKIHVLQVKVNIRNYITTHTSLFIYGLIGVISIPTPLYHMF